MVKATGRLTLLLFGSLFLFGFYSCPSGQLSSRPRIENSDTVLKHVYPEQGSNGFAWARGNVAVSASLPFGLCKPGPDSTFLGKMMSTSGYSRTDNKILGFSQTRLSGTGVWEGGLLRLVPANETKEFNEIHYDSPLASGERHHLFIDRKSELIGPAFYAVNIANHNILSEITASDRGAIYQFTFAKTENPKIYIHLTSSLDLQDIAGVANLQATIDEAASAISVQGKLQSQFASRYDGLPFFAKIKSSATISGHRFLRSVAISTDTTIAQTDREDIYLELSFSDLSGPLELSLALSFVSQAGADANYASEIAGKTFDGLRSAGESAWLNYLSRVTVSDSDADRLGIFYTALYQALLMPVRFNDSSGAYLGFDKTTHTAPGFEYMSDMSLWDTFRTVHPLYNLIFRDIQSDVVQSLIKMGDEGGRLPRWAAGGGYTGSMLGMPASILISEAHQKGINGFDVEAAFNHIKTLATVGSLTKGQECLSQFFELGYCPYDIQDHGSVSYTLEYSYAYHSISLMAELLGRNDDANAYLALSKNASKNWKPNPKAFIPKNSSGAFYGGRPFPWNDNSYIPLTDVGHAYFEGGPRHWRWYMFYDVGELINLFGGANFLVSQLENFFQKGSSTVGSPFPPHYYWHGNEHDLHAAYLFALAGRADLSQYWIDWIRRNKYRNSSYGRDGDDDGGSISSWYTLSAMGIFPIAGTTKYVIGTPFFESLSFDLDGQNVTIEKSDSTKGPYVSRATWNDADLSSAVIEHSTLAAGGTLKFYMSDQATPTVLKGVTP